MAKLTWKLPGALFLKCQFPLVAILRIKNWFDRCALENFIWNWEKIQLFNKFLPDRYKGLGDTSVLGTRKRSFLMLIKLEVPVFQYIWNKIAIIVVIIISCYYWHYWFLFIVGLAESSPSWRHTGAVSHWISIWWKRSVTSWARARILARRKKSFPKHYLIFERPNCKNASS